MNMKSLTVAAFAAPLLIGSAITATTLMTPATAHAQSPKAIVDAAIAKGVVGETAAGYLGLVNGKASPAVINAMNEINIRRKSVYTARARKNGTSVEIMAALTGESQMAKSAPGTKVLTKDGQWVTK